MEPKTDTSRNPNAKLAGQIAMGAGGGIVLGSLLPWASVTAPFVGTITKTGTEGDGTITLGLGVVVAILGLAVVNGHREKPYTVGLVILAVAVGATGLYDYNSVSNAATSLSSETVRASVGSGLVVLLVSAAGAFIAGVMLMQQSPSAAVRAAARPLLTSPTDLLIFTARRLADQPGDIAVTQLREMASGDYALLGQAAKLAGQQMRWSLTGRDRQQRAVMLLVEASREG